MEKLRITAYVVKGALGRMGNLLSSKEAIELLNLMFDINLAYCPVVLCDEGSKSDRELRNNGLMIRGHKYGIVREVVFH